LTIASISQRGSSLRATARRLGRAGQFTWNTAPSLGTLRGHVMVFSGFGETLIGCN